MENPNFREKKNENFDKNSAEEIYNSVLYCIETILGHLDQNTDFDIGEEILETSGKAIIAFILKLMDEGIKEILFYKIVVSSLTSLKLISQTHPNFVAENLGELLGISKAFLMYGLPEYSYQQPQKIMSSQQAIPEPQSLTPNRVTSGRPIKTRKMRTGKNNKKGDKKKTKDEEVVFRQPYSSNAISFDEIAAISNQAYRTSDSDYSDNEINKVKVGRYKQSKTRLTALSLIAAIAQVNHH